MGGIKVLTLAQGLGGQFLAAGVWVRSGGAALAITIHPPAQQRGIIAS